MIKDSLEDRFCAPPELPETDSDRQAFSEARVETFPFEGRHLVGYSLGEGKNVLLVHGWGSRASHMALLARTLANANFHVLAFDGPAHGRTRLHDVPDRSNLFEFCRAISKVGQSLQPLHGVVGHSFGAAAAAFTASGFGKMADVRLSTERLALVSSPGGVESMVRHFCRRTGEEKRMSELVLGLEREFDFSIPGYSVAASLAGDPVRVIIVHDEQDEEIPVEEAQALKQALPRAQWVLTRGSGHQRILGSRAMIRAVKDFLSAP